MSDKAMALYYRHLGLYETDSVEAFLDVTKQLRTQLVVDTLKAAVESHRNGAEPNDDLTMMCLRVN